LRLRCGTSGWQYADWRDVLYPAGLPQSSWLPTYADAFDTVELNGSFYRLAKRETFEKWAGLVPNGFTMAVKASRFLTHVRRLAEPEEPVARLMTSASGLGDRLGPVLLQLPPNLPVDVDRLDACLAEFPPGTRVAVEPRHPSWWVGEVRSVLESRGAALCWADRLGRPVTPLWRTTGWAYLRLHRGRGGAGWSYGRTALRSWLGRLGEAFPSDEEAFVYFNNDPGGAAVRDALQLRRVATS